MTTTFDTDFLKIAEDFADDLIAATLTTYAGTFDRASGARTRTGTPSTVNVSPLFDVEQGHVDGDLVKIGMSWCILPVPEAGLTAVPKRLSSLTALGQKWEIVKVRTLSTGTRTAAYVLFLRGK
jgi:hypothetical protein